jgi:DNA-binding NtrC family response regulator
MTERARVLVVEDSPAVRKLIAAVLQRGFDVETAEDSAAARGLLESSPFDVVLTDIRMPDASGFEVLRVARARAPRAAVVMMTAYANVPDAVAAMRLGAFDYVAKPLEADEISLVVARAAEHAREAPDRSAGAGQEAFPAGSRFDPDVSNGFRRAVEEARDLASRVYLEKLLKEFGGNVTRAATRAGMTRESLHRVLRKYGVHPARETPPPGHHGAAEPHRRS